MPIAPMHASIEDARLYQSIKARLFGAPAEPVRIATHRLIRRLGSGGMGEVFLAHDEELDRPIAIKLVHAKLSHDGRFAERMRREARALAKLAHPNVVHVYEVGEHEGRFFLAMEYVEGQSLGAWIRESESTPTWSQVLDAYLAAGEGLVAAHAAGLTHRDFKPDNVLRGNDGRICVADFGLARVSASPTEPNLRSDLEISFESGEAPSTLDERLSATGAVMGTPSYMPLEQLRGGLVDARSDQFAYCVALYEGLWGRRPHVADNLGARELALVDDRPEVPRTGAVPRWVWPIVRRGLARDPDRRWPDMRTLLDQLRRAPLRRRARQRVMVVVIGLSLALLGGWFRLAASSADPCSDQVHALDEVWNPERRAAIEAVLSVGEPSWGRDNAARVVEQLDRWSERWIDARVEVCRTETTGTEPTGTEPTEPERRVVERQIECLDQRRGELEALLGILAEADTATRERAQSSVHGLADPLACEAIAIAGIGIEPPSAEATAEVATLRRDLAEVEALLVSTRWTDALERADRLLERARAIDYAPVEAEIRFARARAQLELGSLLASREELELALDLAESTRHEHLAIEIWMLLARKIAVLSQDPDAGHDALRRLRAKVAASGREAEYAGDLALSEGHLAVARAEPDQAEAPLRRAIALFDERGRGPDLAMARWVLARSFDQRGRSDQAIEQYRLVRAELERVYGPDHPKVAESRYDLGVALHEHGRADEARVELDHALAIWARAPELSRTNLLDGHLVSAMFDCQDDRLGQAAAHVRAAERLARAQADDNPLALAQVAAAFATIHYRGGDFPAAMREFEWAAAHLDAALGSSDPIVQQTRTGFAWAAVLAGYPDRASLAFARVLATFESREGESSQTTSVRLGLAVTNLLLGDPGAALHATEGLPAELEPLLALERELIRAHAGESTEDSIAGLHESGSKLGSAEQREFDALFARLGERRNNRP